MAEALQTIGEEGEKTLEAQREPLHDVDQLVEVKSLR